MNQEDQIEQLCSMLESDRNFMLGLSLNPRLPKDIADTVRNRAEKCDEYLQRIYDML